jgi:cell division protein FtsW (lipid II flippase)
MDETAKGTPLRLGHSYLEDLMALTPRWIMPDRPEGFAVWITKSLYPETIQHGEKLSGTMGGFIVAEAYFNFGWLGVILVHFIYGVWLQIIYSFFRKKPNDINRLFIYASSIWLLTTNAIRYPIVEQLRGLLISPGLSLVLILFIHMLKIAFEIKPQKSE